jgi:hypothetical protein
MAPYSVTAVFGDGEETVTGAADMTSANPGVVSVNQTATGLTAEASGEAVTVTAAYEGETDTANVTVPGEAALKTTLSDETASPGGDSTVHRPGVGCRDGDARWSLDRLDGGHRRPGRRGDQRHRRLDGAVRTLVGERTGECRPHSLCDAPQPVRWWRVQTTVTTARL